MDINIKVTENSYKQYLKYLPRHQNRLGTLSKKEQLGIGIFLILFYYAVTNIISFPYSDLHIPTLYLVSFPLILLIALFTYFIFKYQIKTTPKKGGIIIGNKNLKMTDIGIEETGEFGKSFYKWDAVDSICEDNGNVYIFLDTIFALIIPESTFTNPDDKKTYMEFIRGKIEEKNA